MGRQYALCVTYQDTFNIINIYVFHDFRSFVEERIYGKQIMNRSVDNAYFHLAFINKFFQASCVTFQTKYRVPPGDLYGVT